MQQIDGTIERVVVGRWPMEIVIARFRMPHRRNFPEAKFPLPKIPAERNFLSWNIQNCRKYAKTVFSDCSFYRKARQAAMLLQFTVGNFKSFKDKATLSLEASHDDWREDDNLAHAVKQRLVKAAAIY